MSREEKQDSRLIQLNVGPWKSARITGMLSAELFEFFNSTPKKKIIICLEQTITTNYRRDIEPDINPIETVANMPWIVRSCALEENRSYTVINTLQSSYWATAITQQTGKFTIRLAMGRAWYYQIYWPTDLTVSLISNQPFYCFHQTTH